MQRYFPDIYLGGENFSPKSLAKIFDVRLSHQNEKGDRNPRLNRPYSIGSCHLLPDSEFDGMEDAIRNVIANFEEIKAYGLIKLGIEESIFTLLITGVLQGGISIKSEYALQICKHFKTLEITVTDEDE